MGTEIKDILDVTVTRETARLARVGFGVPLIMDNHTRLPDRVRTYSDPADMLDDGFLVTDNAYIAASTLMKQALSPKTFKIGRKFGDVNELQSFTIDALATGGTFTMTYGEETTAGIAYDALVATIETAIEGLTGITSVTVVGTWDAAKTMTVEFDGADANTAFDQITLDGSSLTGVASYTSSTTDNGSATETWAVGLAAIIAADNDWYCLLATTRIDADIEALADAIEVLTKAYIWCSDAADLLLSPATDIGSILKAKSYDRSIGLYSADEAVFPECAWAGGQLPEDPGSITWKFKTLVGVTPDDLSANDLTNLQSKNVNYFETVADRNVVTSEAIVASGEYIDIIRGIDWLIARIGEDVFLLLVNEKKVPFTTQGITSVETVILSRLLDAENVGLIAPGTSGVNAPLIDDILVAEKGNRFLDDMDFYGDLAGAIHTAAISGKLSL